MGPLPGGLAAASELPAKVKVEVQAEFQIDLLDYVPLADRQRLVRSGGTNKWDSGIAARHVTPQILKDVFVEDLTHVLKPISSLFTVEHRTTCDSKNTQISHQQIYSVVVPDGRTTEVTIDTTTFNSNPLETCSPNSPLDREPSKDSGLQHTQSSLCKSASGSGIHCCPVGNTGLYSGTAAANFVIRTRIEPSDGSATYPIVECNNGSRLESVSSDFSRDEVDHISLKKRHRMLSSDLCIDWHFDGCTEFMQTSRSYSVQPDMLFQANASGITTNLEKSRIHSCYSKTDREDVGCTQDMSICADDRTKESHVTVSSSGASCTVCQLPQSFSDCFYGTPQGNQEKHPSSCLHLACMPEMTVVPQSEACLSANNQILQPVPLVIKEELKDEASENNSSSQFYKATVIQNSHVSLSGSPDYGNIWFTSQKVSDFQDNVSFTSCNLQENQVAASTGLDLASVPVLKVPVDKGNEKPINSGIHDLQKKVKLETLEECIDDGHPHKSTLEDLCMPTSESPGSFNTDNLFAPTMLTSLSRNGIDNVAKNTSSHGNIEGKDNCYQSSGSEVKATVFGQKRVQLDSDNRITDSSLSNSLLSMKMEPAEGNYYDSDSQINSREYLSSSTYFSEKTFVLTPCASQLCSSEAVNCEESILTEAPAAYPPEVELPVLEKNQACFDANEHVPNSALSASSFTIKAEPFEGNPDDIAPENPGKCSSVYNFSVSPLEVKVDLLEIARAPVKTEITEELSVDVLDHIPLQERTEMLISSRDPEFKICSGSDHSGKSPSFMSGADPVSSAGNISTNSARRHKRKRTATDSVETALEEDAPALLQVLIENGINPKEIKLYEIMDDDGTLDVSSEDNFDEFENVILKLFSERPNSLFKLCKLRDENGTKAAYCLACLISLIEQTYYMQLQNCPVEWGWCRDLQSFIFVFERHNRIVLERPEYGYATYFFELVESFPVDWQIKRLVTAMKLAKYSRITLIENKSLMIGEDLTEGEALVLEEYGWKPNSGLGSFLNFCDRVVHDRRNETDNSDWRSKIGKLLKNGYDGGRIVMDNLPKKVVEYVSNQQRAIKLELDVKSK